MASCVDNLGEVSTANLSQGSATTIEWRLVKGTAANHTTVLASGTGNGNLTAGNLAEGTMVWLQYRTSANGNWVDEGSFRTIGNCTGSGVPTLDKSSPNDGATVPLGSTIHYKVVVGNTGNAPITSRPVVDTLPDGVTYVTGSSTSVTTGGGTASAAPTTGTSGGHNTLTWTVTLPPSATATFEFDVTVNANNPRAAELKNTAAFENLTDFTVHTVEIPASNPTLDKSSPNDGATVPLGSTIHYKVVVGNTGNAPITSRPVVDTLPDGVTYVTGSSTSVTTGGGTASAAPTTGTSGGHNTLTWTVTLPPSATATFEFDVTVNANNPRAAELKNTAAFENLTDFTVHTVEIPASNPTLDKSSPNDGATVPLGSTIHYKVVVGNTGNAPITSRPVVDTLPDGVTYVTGSSTSVTTGGGTASAAPTTGTSGGHNTLTWTVTLPPSATATFEFDVTVNANNPRAAELKNTAAFENLTDFTVHTVEIPASNPTLDKSSPNDGATVPLGSTIHYKVVVGNTGNAPITSRPVVDTLPDGVTYVTGSSTSVTTGGGTASAAPTAGTSGGHNTLTWTVTLPPSATATFEFDVTVNANNPRAAELRNTAAFESLTDFTVHTVGIPNPTLDKFANPTTTETSPALVAPGTRIDYSVKVGNTGNFPITNAPVVDTLPNNVTLVASTISDAGALSSDGRTITWSVTLTPGASKTFTYAVTVDQATPQGAVLVNTAKFQNLTDTTTHVVPTGALSLVKGVSPVAGNGVVVEFGDTLTYTLTAAATGNLDQPNVVVTDYVPGSDPARPGSGSTTYVTGSAACIGAGTCTVTGPDANGLITWNLGTMAAGTSRQVTFQVTIDDVTGEAGATVAVDVLNAGAVKSDRTPVTSSNEVTTPVTKVLGVKTPNEEQPGAGPVTQPGTLPHTGAGLPLGATVGGSLVLVAMGLLLTGAGRRPRTAVR